MNGTGTDKIPRSLKRFEHMIDDWYTLEDEEFKYDVLLKAGYAWGFWRGDHECQCIEQFNTVAEARKAFMRIIKVDPAKNCAKCCHWDGSMCHA